MNNRQRAAGTLIGIILMSAPFWPGKLSVWTFGTLLCIVCSVLIRMIRLTFYAEEKL